MNTNPSILNQLKNMDHHAMLVIVKELDTLAVPELHNLISKSQVLRALLTLALQEKKYPTT